MQKLLIVTQTLVSMEVAVKKSVVEWALFVNVSVVIKDKCVKVKIFYFRILQILILLLLLILYIILLLLTFFCKCKFVKSFTFFNQKMFKSFYQFMCNSTSLLEKDMCNPNPCSNEGKCNDISEEISTAPFSLMSSTDVSQRNAADGIKCTCSAGFMGDRCTRKYKRYCFCCSVVLHDTVFIS